MEALLKLTNRELKTVVNERLFTKEALSKFITEFEDITNSQPLMPASDKFDKLKPVIPNHLLLGKSSPNYQPNVTDIENINVRKR